MFVPYVPTVFDADFGEDMKLWPKPENSWNVIRLKLFTILLSDLPIFIWRFRGFLFLDVRKSSIQMSVNFHDFFFILGLNSQNYISKSDEVDKLNLSDEDCEKLT